MLEWWNMVRYEKPLSNVLFKRVESKGSVPNRPVIVRGQNVWSRDVRYGVAMNFR